MQYSVTFLEPHFESLMTHLFSNGGNEQAAFLLGRNVTTANSINLLVRKVIPVEQADIISASPVHMSIKSQSYLRVMKQADLNGDSFIFVHSHPTGLANFSKQDDGEERALFKTAFTRIHHDTVHASLVFTDRDTFCGRIHSSDGRHSTVRSVGVIGNRLQFLHSEQVSDVPLEYFDRQARAFTSELQPILKRLHIGIVGIGGTGSAVCEQLIRLGVGKLTIIDGGIFEKSNVNRVYGATVFDENLPKVNIAARYQYASIGLGTEVRHIQGPFKFPLRDSSIIGLRYRIWLYGR